MRKADILNKFKLSNLKAALLWVMRPVTAQLPLFLFSFILLSLNTIFCGFKMSLRLLHGVYPEGMTVVLIYLSIALFFAYIFALIAYLAKRKWVKIAIYSLVITLFAVYCFLQLNFHSIMTPTIMMAMAETNANETSEFFSQFVLSWQSIVTYLIVALTIVAVVLVEKRFAKKVDKTDRKPIGRVSTIALSVLFPCLMCGVVNMRYYYQIFKADYLSELEQSQMFSHGTWAMDDITDWVYCLKAMKSSAKEVKRSIESTFAVLDKPITTQADSLTVVLVIGESYIKSHAGIYGYQLNTTPHMQDMLNRGKLVAFTNCISPYNTTNISLKNALSTNSIGDGENWYETPYWPTLVAKAGYSVAIWDNQYSFSPLANGGSLDALLYNDRIAEVTYAARNEQAFDYDGDLVDNCFSELTKRGFDVKPRQMVILHLMGQHVKPSKRYPKDYNHFKADNEAYSRWSKSQAQYRAEYDNATLYNDAVINSLAQHYADRCAVMVYFSDHGEEAYDFRSSFGRQNDPVKTKNILHYQNDVPFVIWFSDKYESTYPDVVSRIRKAASRPMMLDLLGHLIFDLARIDSPVYRSVRDVISPDYHCPPRITYNNVDYDKVCK